MTDEILVYFTYELERDELSPTVFDTGEAVAHKVTRTHRRYAINQKVPLQGGTGSGYIFSFPDGVKTNIREIGFQFPNIDGMIERAKESGRKEILDLLEQKSKRKVLKRYRPYRSSYGDYDSWYED